MEPLQFWSEFWVLPGLIVTTIASLILLILHLTHWQGSEHLAITITKNTTPVIVLVQIISHVLGMIMIQSICEYQERYHHSVQ